MASYELRDQSQRGEEKAYNPFYDNAIDMSSKEKRPDNRDKRFVQWTERLPFDLRKPDSVGPWLLCAWFTGSLTSRQTIAVLSQSI
jgi:hypothetical protein